MFSTSVIIDIKMTQAKMISTPNQHHKFIAKNRLTKTNIQFYIQNIMS